MQDYFSYSGRYGRQRYFLLWLSFFLVLTVGVLPWTLDDSDSPVRYTASLIAAVLFSPAVVKRLHDIGRPGWHYWLTWIPLYNIYLAVLLFGKRGVSGANEYGEDPTVARTGIARTWESMAPQYRDCPYCAEPIRAAAIKCRHCSSVVEPLPTNGMAVSTLESDGKPNAPQVQTEGGPTEAPQADPDETQPSEAESLGSWGWLVFVLAIVVIAWVMGSGNCAIG